MKSVVLLWWGRLGRELILIKERKEDTLHISRLLVARAESECTGQETNMVRRPGDSIPDPCSYKMDFFAHA
jgi:hypothetical protein